MVEVQPFRASVSALASVNDPAELAKIKF